MGYSDDKDKNIPDLASRTRRDPFKAMMPKLSNKPSIIPAGSSTLPSPSNQTPGQPENRQPAAELRSKSPNRRLSKIPSSSNLSGDANSKANGCEEMFKAIMRRYVDDRTLVELAQGRAGRRPCNDVKRISSDPRVYMVPHFFSNSANTPATWDPNCEQMPSPFLSRRVVRSLRYC
jgi:hypothetical protein